MPDRYAVIVRVMKPGYEPPTLKSKYDWISALQYEYIAIEHVIHQEPPAALLADAANAPQPSRLTELELEQERLGDALGRHDVELAELQAMAAELTARVDAEGAQRSAIVARVMDMAGRLAQIDGRCRDCVWATREAE